MTHKQRQPISAVDLHSHQNTKCSFRYLQFSRIVAQKQKVIFSDHKMKEGNWNLNVIFELVLFYMRMLDLVNGCT